jgi:hypothetical protein
MKRIFISGTGLLIALFMLGNSAALAQGMEREGKTTANASQVYLEAGGAGVIYSVNYDGRFGKLENGLGMRVGIGGAEMDIWLYQPRSTTWPEAGDNILKWAQALLIFLPVIFLMKGRPIICLDLLHSVFGNNHLVKKD